MVHFDKAGLPLSQPSIHRRFNNPYGASAFIVVDSTTRIRVYQRLAAPSPPPKLYNHQDGLSTTRSLSFPVNRRFSMIWT